MKATHKDAEDRYTTYRKAVIDEVNKDLLTQRKSLYKATLITNEALIKSVRWEQSPKRRVDWDWINGYSTFKFRYPKRFEMALWYQNKLASLSLGRPTYNGHSLRLDYIEGNPEKSENVKVFEPTLIAMVAYAEIMGADELRVMHPISTTVREHYERFGLQYIANGDYLFIKL